MVDNTNKPKSSKNYPVPTPERVEVVLPVRVTFTDYVAQSRSISDRIDDKAEEVIHACAKIEGVEEVSVDTENAENISEEGE